MATLTEQEYLYYRNAWCRSQGFGYRDLTEHSQIDDVVILIKYIHEFHKEFTEEHRRRVWVCWDWVYRNRLPLKKRHTKWLLKIGNEIQGRRTQTKRQRQRQQFLIKQRRNRTLA